MATSLNNSAWLEWMATLMEGVSRHTYAATFPPDRFYCLLDELPLHLVPQHALRSLRGQQDLSQPFRLNPSCVICSNGQVPEEFVSRKELLKGFALQGTVAWVQNPATGNRLPFWLGPQLESVVRDLRPNETVPATVSKSSLSLLAAANILISSECAGSSLGAGQATLATSRLETGSETWTQTLFREKGYAPLRGLIHPFHIAALRRYYRCLIRSGAIHLGDKQSSRRYVAYNEPVARFFHHDIAATLSAVAAEPLKPSYVYMASYLGGAELKKHTDREQCEFSVTLCLDFSPEPSLATPWPIRLDTPTGTVTVYQALGDGLAYRGTLLPHHRSRLSEGHTSTSIFFHYVGIDFAGSLD